MKSRRKKTDTKSILRKQYNTLKKKYSKEFRKQKQIDFKKLIKQLAGTKSEKATRRKAIKENLHKKLKTILSKMPSPAQKDSKVLQKMIAEIKQLRW